MDRKEAAKIILKELEQFPLLTGKYDADNGNDSFMFGIMTVMECIADFVDLDTRIAFSTKFISNMVDS